jgi:two-component system response regulator
MPEVKAMSNRRHRIKKATILLVEDDPGDQELTRRALADDVFQTDLRIVQDGKEALDYLHREGAFIAPEDSPRPDLILLDLNMPRVDGRQVLERVREDPEISRIPVITLTTSDEEEDVLRSYDLGCKSFIKKPVEIDKFIEAIRELQHYWFELVTLPADSPQRR